MASQSTSEATPRGSDARDRLVSAARVAFAEKGYAATTTRDIAARAGMSPAAVYVHHRTKEDLLFAISRDGHLSALEVLREAAASASDPKERVRAMVEAFSRWHAVNSRTGRIVQYEFEALTPAHRAEIAAYRREMEALVQSVLTEGVEAGVLNVRDVKGTARALLGLSIDLVRWYRPGGAITPDDMAQLHGDLASRMVTD